ncbi:MAG TPA: carbohydrate ABC transporter permease [Candidatus Dormibacteraeota bacterium]|nr:carbohydrate ABC transporter permease [Candidatus Dormibacteraeota bacterium]
MTTAVASRPAATVRERRTEPGRLLLYGCAVLITLFMLTPVYLIALAAFSTPEAIFDYPHSLLPTSVSLDNIRFFLTFQGIVPALLRSVAVGILTVALSLLLGCPAGYALARYWFRGKDLAQLVLVNVRAIPMVIITIPLLVTFIEWNLSDTVWSVALVHAAITLPLTILISASVFVRVPAELEEAAMSLGTSRLGAVLRVVLPNSVPGLAAAALFAFVTSWNEVFVAVILTLRNPTLPAALVQQLSESPLAFRFAGGLCLTIPAFVFIFFMRPYLFNAFGVGGK